MRVHGIAVAAVLAMAFTTPAQDWPQWRGPARDGAVATTAIPKAWPAKLETAWRVELGEGYSSPVVSGNRVFVHSRRDPEELVSAVDLATGKILWQQRYTAQFAKNQYASKMAKGPNSTPLAIGNRLFTMGVTGVVSAWNPADGALLWRKDYSASVDTSKLFCGTAMSPMMEGGAIIVQVGSDIHGGRILALDPATGAERWTWRGLGPGYASPLAINAGNTRLIVAMTEGSIEGLDAKTGASLWSVPFPDEWHENISTPVWNGSHLFISGPRQGTHAYSIVQAAGKWQVTEVWKNPDVTMYMSTPVLADGLLYAHSVKKKGQFVALDAATGAVRWATEGRGGEHASILLTPANILYLTNGADLILARRATDKFTEERRYDDIANSETYALPVIVPGALLVRDSTGLARLKLGS